MTQIDGNALERLRASRVTIHGVAQQMPGGVGAITLRDRLEEIVDEPTDTVSGEVAFAICRIVSHDDPVAMRLLANARMAGTEARRWPQA